MKNFRMVLSMFAVVIACIGALAFAPVHPTATTTLFFGGDVTNPLQVADEARWAENNPDPGCTFGPAACEIEVDLNDVSGGIPGQRVLNPSRIQLTAVGLGGRYRPEKDVAASVSTNPISPVNKP